MKILFLTNNLSRGGAERVLVNLANDLAKKNHDITVRSLVNKGENRALLSPEVKYEFIFKKGFRGINFLHLLPHKWIYKKIAYGDFDVIVVYLHGVLTKIVSYAPVSQKTVAYLHANMEKSPFIKSFKTKEHIQKCFKNYDRIVAVSREVKDSFIKVSDINDERLVVKYNTFDVEKIKTFALESINFPFEAKCGTTMCVVGKLEDVKGHQRLLDTIKKLISNGIYAQLMIVGDGRLKYQLEEYIKSNSLEDYIHIVGFDINPYKYIATSDLLVVSSFSEGFSSVVAEALILGVPVLTTDCAGMKEILGDNNEYGLIVENSEQGLYDGLCEILTDSALLEKYRLAAKKRGAFFEPEQTSTAIENMFEEILNEQ